MDVFMKISESPLKLPGFLPVIELWTSRIRSRKAIECLSSFIVQTNFFHVKNIQWDIIHVQVFVLIMRILDLKRTQMRVKVW
jgi:hypothetical protein